MPDKIIYTVYAKEDDLTFIMEETKTSLSVKGFYFGEPDEDATKLFYDSLTAHFEEN